MSNEPDVKVIGIPLYDGVDLLDVAAPREIFTWAAAELKARGTDLEVYYLAEDDAPVRTRDGSQLLAEKAFDDEQLPPLELIWVPGGDPGALARMIGDPNSAFLEYVKRAGATASFVASVCEGAVLLASTGLLDGYQATTHWACYPCMDAYPDVHLVPPVADNRGLKYPRFVRDRNRITGGGISSGLDEALFIVDQLFGRDVAEAAQATTQYFPEPPVAATLGKADCCPIPDWPVDPCPPQSA